MYGTIGSLSTATRVISTTSATPIRVNGTNLPADVSTLTATEGDLVRNTSASAGAGWYTGPVVWDAGSSKWTPIRGYAQTGTATLVGGTVTVANTRVAAYSKFRLFHETPGGTPGGLFVSARSVGTSFTITSSSGTDTSVVRWEAIYW